MTAKNKKMTQSKKIWMDGKFVEWKDANIHVLTHTLHYGLGIFEGIRCYRTKTGTAVFRVKEHIDRLFNSAAIVGIKIPYKKEEIIQAVKETISANDLNECYIRPIVYLGNDRLGLDCRGIDVHTVIAAWPWGAYLGEEALSKGIKTRISSFTRHHVNINMTKAKVCGNYVNSIMAKAEAVANGYDEAILLDMNGNVAEGSGENIFIVKDDMVKTPPLTNILAGITRDSVLEIIKREQICVKEEFFPRDELYIADEAFFTGTAAEITPIREVDKRVLGNDELGEITKKIQKIFFASVHGKDNRFKKWLSYI